VVKTFLYLLFEFNTSPVVEVSLFYLNPTTRPDFADEVAEQETGCVSAFEFLPEPTS